MSARSVWKWLWRWIEKLRVAFWLNEREFDAGRRALLFGCAAVVAATVLVQLPEFDRVGSMPAIGPLSAELNTVMRRAFIPRVYVQLWKSTPLMSEWLHDA